MEETIENIASVSEENSTAVEEVSAAAGELNTQVQEVTASAQILSEMAQKLDRLMTQFNLSEADVHLVESVSAESVSSNPLGVNAPKQVVVEENNGHQH